MFTPNRVVTLLTPVFAGLAGSLASWMAQHLPGGPKIDKAELTAIFIAGATSATAAAYKWLHGWQAHEGRVGIPIGPPVYATGLAYTTGSLGVEAKVNAKPEAAGEPDEPGDAFDALPHHPVTDPATIPPDNIDPPSGATVPS
jgi:hypothetical protein